MSAANPYENPTVHTTSSTRRTVTMKRLDVVSCGVMLGVLYALIGLLAGGFLSLLAFVGAAAQNGNPMAGVIGGVGAVVILPLMYGFMGFIGGMIGALLYNACASVVGGIKFDLE